MNVEMTWLSPKHLELAYPDPRTLDLEAVRWHGGNITLRDGSIMPNPASSNFE
jgi:hypothetical protein